MPITIIVKVRLHLRMFTKRHLLTQFESYEKLEVNILKHAHYIEAHLLLRYYRFNQRIDECTIVNILTLQIKEIFGFIILMVWWIMNLGLVCMHMLGL